MSTSSTSRRTAQTADAHHQQSDAFRRFRDSGQCVPGTAQLHGIQQSPPSARRERWQANAAVSGDPRVSDDRLGRSAVTCRSVVKAHVHRPPSCEIPRQPLHVAAAEYRWRMRLACESHRLEMRSRALRIRARPLAGPASVLGCQLGLGCSSVAGTLCAAGRSLPGMSLAFALMAAINGSTGSSATLACGLKGTKLRRRQSGGGKIFTAPRWRRKPPETLA